MLQWKALFMHYRTTDQWPKELRNTYNFGEQVSKAELLTTTDNVTEWPTSFITQYKTLTHRNFIKTAKHRFDKIQIISVHFFS